MKTKIAFDFDGVIANTTRKKQEWLEKQNIKLKNNDKTNFYQELQKTMNKEAIDKIYQEMSKHIFTEKTLLETDAIEGAIDSIKRISQQYDIFIITARTPSLIIHVNKWLEKNGINQNVVEILSSSCTEKQDICCQYGIQFLCDDDKRHLEKEKIKTKILFNQQKKSSHMTIKQVNSWKEIEKILL